MNITKLIAVFTALMITSGFLFAQPSISISTDKTDYSSDDTIEVDIDVSNGNTLVTVDLYYALLTPTEKLLFFPSWSEDINKIPNITLLANFSLSDILLTYNLPSAAPLIDKSGNYTFAIGLAKSGTLEFLSVDTAFFRYTAGAGEKLSSITVDLTRDYTAGEVEEYVTLDFDAYEYEKSPDYTDYPELDECVFKSFSWSNDEPPPSNDGIISKGLDAGESILITGSPEGNLYFNRTTIPSYPGYYYEPDREIGRADFVYSNPYEFSGSGGTEVGSFDVIVVSQSDFTVETPILGSGISINRKEPLEVSWTNPSGSPHEVMVLITSRINDIRNMMSTRTNCHCRFVDDGFGVISQDMLEKLAAPLTSFDSASISISKVKQDEMDTGGIKATVKSSITETSDCSIK